MRRNIAMFLILTIMCCMLWSVVPAYAQGAVSHIEGVAESKAAGLPVVLLVYDADKYRAGNYDEFEYVCQGITGDGGAYSFDIPTSELPESYVIRTKIYGEEETASFEENDNIIYDDFEDYAGGKNSKMWQTKTPDTSYIPYTYADGTALEIKIENGAERLVAYKASDLQGRCENVYKVSFKAMTNGAWFYTCILNNAWSGLGNTANYYRGFYFKPAAMGHYDGFQDWAEMKIADNSQDTWHDVQIWIDGENERIFYDIDNGASTGYTDFTLTDGFAGIAFVANGAANSSIYLDDVKVEYANWTQRKAMIALGQYVPAELQHSHTAKISSVNVGNIFYNESTPALDINIKSGEEAATTKNITVIVNDQNGAEVDRFSREISFGATETKTITYTPENIKYGTYTVDVKIGDERIGGGKFSKVVAADELSDTYGVCVHYDRAWADVEDSMALVKNAGFGMTRTDWGLAVDKDESFYDLTEINSNFKTYTDISKADGMDVLAVARFSSDTHKIEVSGTGFAATTENLEMLKSYYEYLARTQKDTLKYFEIGNEVGYITNGDPVDYAKILQAAYRGIKAGNAEAKVLAFAHTVKTAADRTFIKGALDWMKEQGEYYFDIFSVHCYHERLAPETVDANIEDTNWLDQAETAKELLQSYGLQDKEIWTTETGYHTADSSVYMAQTEKDAAAYMVRMMALNDAKGYYDKMVFYNLTDNGTRTNYDEHNWGMTDTWKMVETPLAAKQSYVTTSFYNSIVGNAEAVEVVKETSSTEGGALGGLIGGTKVWQYEYKFKKPGADVTMLWFTGSGTKTSAYTVAGKGAKVYDMYGNVTQTLSAGEKVELTVSGMPIYVEDYNDELYVVNNGTVIESIKGLSSGTQLKGVYKTSINPGGVIIAAQYKENVLQSAIIGNVTGKEGYVDFVYDGKSDLIKLFKFNSLKNLKPDCDYKPLDNK